MLVDEYYVREALDLVDEADMEQAEDNTPEENLKIVNDKLMGIRSNLKEALDSGE
jgi:hypothetical protein